MNFSQGDIMNVFSFLYIPEYYISQSIGTILIRLPFSIKNKL